MNRSASDNEYLHKDFHGALSTGIEYLHRNFGEDAVREYLRDFSRSFYAPLMKEVKEQGLSALKDHFEQMYKIEGGSVRISCTEDELIIQVEECPAVSHMRKHGYKVAELFFETSRTVNETLCEGTPLAAELLNYDQETGRCVQRFYRRNS